MWNSWQYLRQVKSYQRLAVALALSLLLHLLLLGEFDFNLPDLDQSHSFIEARLVALKPAPEQKQPVQPAIKKQIAKPPPQPRQKSFPHPEPVSSAPPLPNAAASYVASTKDQVASITQNPSVELPQSDRPDETDLTINPNAYKYVETEFDVRTELNAKVDASPAGRAKIVYQSRSNGEQYQLKSLIQANGFLALFMPDLLQTSDGFLTSSGIRPQHYLYQFGDKKDKTYSADFDWERKKLRLHSSKADTEADLVEGAQDLVSFMYQFMFVAPLQNMQLSVTNGKKLGTYDYGFEGEETIATKMGNLTTIHLMRQTAEGEEKTELWLALDYQYVPVKIRKIEKEGKVYELLVTSLKTEPPATQPE